MLETIFHWWTCVQICTDEVSVYIDPLDVHNQKSDTHWHTISHPACWWTLVSIWNKNIFHYTSHKLDSWLQDLHNDYDIDVAFLSFGDDTALSFDDAVIAASYIQSKFIVPMHTSAWAKALDEMISFARCVLLENYAVPKVLRIGQAIVLHE